jgi:transposase
MQSKEKKMKKAIQGLPVMNPYAAGADIGDTRHDLAVNDGKGGHIVRTFGTFTSEVQEAVNWLKEEGITTVAMESTGVYYLTFYLMCEQAGIEPYLVNARHVKNVTGRKKDETDAMWIQRLHTCGLLKNCFQPDNDFRTLRTYVRQRKGLITRSSDEVRRMQKSLEQMNIKIHTVISDILGKTGMQIIRAILDGNHDPEELSELRDPRIKATREDIVKSLQGVWKEEYLFTLAQSYDTYMFYQHQIRECDKKIHIQLLTQVAKANVGEVPVIEGKNKKKGKSKKNEYTVPIAPLLASLTGVDLCKIPAINEASALEFISETGIDTKKWSSLKCFAAWLNVAPNTKITGGKIISSKLIKKKNRAGQTLRMACACLYGNKSPLGDYYRRMSFKYGKRGASLAAAHKLARIIFTMLNKKQEFSIDMLIDSQEKYRQEIINRLERQIARLKKVA